MIDFLKIASRSPKRGVMEIYPKFIIKNSNDLMIRGGDFYAIWDEQNGIWSTDEQSAIKIIDSELKKFYEENKKKYEYYDTVIIRYMWDSDSGVIDRFHKYCQKQMRDNFHMLDEQLIFSNTETLKENFASKKLPYPLENGSIKSYEKLISTLYSKEEREKIEWAIGSIVSGDSKSIQKFMVLYGAAGTGKSTILNIIQKLFEGYYSVFDAKALGSSSNSFALEAFKNNPLVAIQHDGDLSRIEDNTRLNSLVSHELMTVNEKFKSTYANRFKCFLFMGTNKPVKITDAKSGLIRRLIDVSPTGEKIPAKEYKTLMKQVDFELGAIAKHCLDFYLDNKSKYDNYIPVKMLGASNDFYNYILDSYLIFKKENSTTLKMAWQLYKVYCDDAKVLYPLSQRAFKEELKNYFKEYYDRYNLDGTRVRSYYVDFREEIFENKLEIVESEEEKNWIEFKETDSQFDISCLDCSAQYGNKEERPSYKWDNVKTKLADLDTRELHYVKVPENHIVIDFDIPDEKGEKSLEKNLKAASKFPPTYAELSKSGAGIHLHYIYTGNVEELSRIYDEHIEIKVFNGKSSLRRKLTKCNDLKIAQISSGLPKKKGDKMINFEAVKSEKAIRKLITRNLNKEIHPGTKPSVDFIYKILEDAYESGLGYDVTDMRNGILAFAAGSTHQADYCIKLVNKMKFKSEEPSKAKEADKDEIVFFDVEVFPNLFLINWKKRGNDKIVRMINPKAADVEALFHYKLVGYNNRRYDNHILYAASMGYTNEQLYNLSQKIISQSKNCFFGEAYNLSYTDIYDFCSEKKSLKKWEIELGIHHKELGLPWDEPVPEEKWDLVSAYCDNDVIATEAVWEARQADFTARQILADVAGGTVNDTTNSLTTKIIFGRERKPQNQFNYRDMGDESQIAYYILFDKNDKPIRCDRKDWNNETEYLDVGSYTTFTKDGKPIFPGYKFERGKSTYRDEEVGEGGYVWAIPGMHGNTALDDVASMHPHSAIAEELFGIYTRRFKDLVDARIAIKHKDFESARKMLDGALAPYLTDESSAKELAKALKIAINSVYGLTSAKFDNPFRDNRNKDNIVAKRGALFMINLKHEVEKRGFIVAHIKTDSIKIPDATPEIIKFVDDYGALYGYTFEHEATYERMCLVNDAVYIAKYASKDKCEELYGYIPGDNFEHSGKWTATGTQFAVPYVFKTLFSKEPIEFGDMCETKSVTSSLYLDMNEDLPDVSEFEKELTKNDQAYRKGELSDTMYDNIRDELIPKIEEGHNYIFVGRVGRFCPVKEGTGGGLLCREKDGKYYSATGAKGYRWKEAEVLLNLGKEDEVECSYYDKLVYEAIETISKYGDFEWFISDDPYISPIYMDGKPVYKDYLRIN